MAALGYHRFESPIGALAIAWSERGVCGFRLPDAPTERSRRTWGTVEAEAPSTAAAVRDDVLRLLAGETVLFDQAAFDFGEAPAFDQAVWRTILRIPPGRTSTYGAIAAEIAAPGEQRRVGQALGRNPIPLAVPCHRVLGAGGALGGFSAPGGTNTKLVLLNLERRLFGAGDGGLFGDMPLAVRP